MSKKHTFKKKTRKANSAPSRFQKKDNKKKVNKNNISAPARLQKNYIPARTRKRQCLKQLRDCDASNKIERGKSPMSYYEKKARNNPKCGKLYNKCMGEESGYEPDSKRPSYYGNSNYSSNSQ